MSKWQGCSGDSWISLGTLVLMLTFSPAAHTETAGTTEFVSLPREHFYDSAEVVLDCDAAASLTPLTMIEAVRLAICSEPDTRKAWAEVEEKTASYSLARADYWPTVNFTETGGYRRSSDSVEGESVYNGVLDEKGYTTQVELTWKLFDFGVTRAKNLSARYALAAALASKDEAVQTATIDASKAFLDVLDAMAELAADRDAETDAHEGLSSADTRYRSGMAAITDRLQAQTAYADARVRRVTAEGLLQEIVGKLNIAIGRPASSPTAVDTTAAELPEDISIPPVEVLVAEAERNNPAMEAARASVEAAAASLAAARADNRPVISLYSSWKQDIERSDSATAGETYAGLPPNNITGDRGVQLRITIPLFDGFAHEYRVAQARAESIKAVAASWEVERQMSLEVWTRYQELHVEYSNYIASIELITDARNSYNAAKDRYRAGLGTIVDVVNAQAALASAMGERIRGISKWRMARLRLAASLGHLK